MTTEPVQPSGYDPNSMNTLGAHHLADSPRDAKPAAEEPQVLDVVFKKDVQSDHDSDADSVNNDHNNNDVNLLSDEPPPPAPDPGHLQPSPEVEDEPPNVLAAAPRNEKADAIMEAHKERVEVEANAYLQSEMRKVHARANMAQVIKLLLILHYLPPRLLIIPNPGRLIIFIEAGVLPRYGKPRCAAGALSATPSFQFSQHMCMNEAQVLGLH